MPASHLPASHTSASRAPAGHPPAAPARCALARGLLAFAGAAALAAAPQLRAAEPAPAVAAGREAPAARGTRAPTPGARPAAESSPAQRLAQLFEEYWERGLELSPISATFQGDHRWNDRLPNSIGEAHLARQLAFQKEFLARAEAIDPAQLAGQDRLSWEIFTRARRQDIAGFRFQSELLPINQFFGLPQLMAQLGSGTGAQPFRTVQDYENWLKRVDGFLVWIDQAIVNMRRGADKGLVQPRVVVEKTLPILQALVVADLEKSPFWRPVANFPETVPAAERERLTDLYRAMLGERLQPALARLHAFMRDEYLPKARDGVALTALPLGEEWYAHQVQVLTTTSLSPAEIHAIGLDEVARIGAEIDRVARELGFRGERAAFFESLRNDPRFYYATEQELLDGYRAIGQRVRPRLPEQFDLMPKAQLEIRAVEPFRARTAASASYMPPAPDGSRPGVFYVNTYDLKSRPKYSMEAIYLHEAEPGHHFQIALAQELEELPKFRRFGGDTAYVEGWGLYAESLGRELGLYTDPYMYVGALSAEIWRAVRLVTDTGMHAKGWTRQQALDYMLANAAVGRTDAEAEIDRYIAWPGQALAYKIGELRIRELKARAQKELGPRFDVRAFHREVLADGSLPLDVLDTKIGRWIEAERRRADAPR